MSISFRKRLISHLKFLGHLFAPIAALVAIIGGIYTFYTKPWQPMHKALSEIVELLRPPAERARVAVVEQAERDAATERERARIAAAEQPGRHAKLDRDTRDKAERETVVTNRVDQSRVNFAPDAEIRNGISFNGIWNVTWKGVSNCSNPNLVETYALHIRDGHIFVANRDYSGRVSSSGVVQWSGNATKYGGFVQYDGVLSGSSGEGRFQNTMGCRGTFTARKRQADG